MSGEKAGEITYVPPELGIEEKEKLEKNAIENDENNKKSLENEKDSGFGEIEWDDSEDDNDEVGDKEEDGFKPKWKEGEDGLEEKWERDLGAQGKKIIKV